MATETRQLNVRIPVNLYDAFEAAVANRKASDDVKHGYSKNDAVQEALRAWLTESGPGHPETDLVAAIERLERLGDDLERLRKPLADMAGTCEQGYVVPT